MKLLYILLFLVNLTCYGKSLVWHDEFDGDKLDLAKWSYDTQNRNDAVNAESQVFVSGGCLHIRVDTVGDEILTGFIKSQGKFESSYGYWEVRAKFGDVSGTWSDAWLYHPDVAAILDDVDKAGIEVDIFEHRHEDRELKNIDDLVSHALHWNGYEDFKKCVSKESPIDNSTFHIYGLSRTPTEFIFYIDNEEVWRTPPSTSKPLFILLSTEVQRNYWAGLGLAEYHVETLTVDYVRFYK